MVFMNISMYEKELLNKKIHLLILFIKKSNSLGLLIVFIFF